jgi:CRISPR-associated protein Cas2
MSRRHYLITYDISDDKRRTKVFNTLQANGDHAQYSVFLCQLNPTELACLRAVLQPLINNSEDQILILDFGKVYSSDLVRLETIGRGYCPQVRTMIV